MDDLYAGIPLPTSSTNGDLVQKKRKDYDHIEKDTQNVKSQDVKRPKSDRRTMDLSTTLTRLQTHIMVDKKFAQAARLLTQLIREQLTSDTSALFMDTFKEMMTVKLVTWSGKHEFAELIEALLLHVNLFSIEEQAQIENWKFYACTHYNLLTDDTYEFARAVKQIQLRLDTTLSIDDAKERTNEMNLLFPVLRTLFRRHTTPWATSMVESVLKTCSHKRLLLEDESQRSQVDEWTTVIQKRRHAPISNRSDARRNLIDMNTTTTSQATAKVGRTNHPLFNRD